MNLTVGNGENSVQVAGLKSFDENTFSEFDGISLTLKGCSVEKFSDLTITGGANNVRRTIWQGEVDGVERDAVLIVDNDGDGTLKGGWLVLGNEKNVLTYYTDASKISAESNGSVDEDSAAISLQFIDQKSALIPRRFTFIEKTSAGDGAILSIGSAFDNVTISAGNSNQIYFSRTAEGLSKLNGVLQPLATAKVNSENWTFSDEDSFIVEDDKKIFIGDNTFDCDSEIAACKVQFGKVLSETTANKISEVHYNKNSQTFEVRREKN